jgi:hypothetical protein
MKLYPHIADAEIFAVVAADLALASSLNWARPILLLAVASLQPSFRRDAGARERAMRSLMTPIKRNAR